MSAAFWWAVAVFALAAHIVTPILWFLTQVINSFPRREL